MTLLWPTIVQIARLINSLEDAIEQSGMPMTDQMAHRIAWNGIRLARRVMEHDRRRTSQAPGENP